jgi:hypothetical protein
VEEAVGRYALAQVDWILGKNPYDVSFLEGVGRRGSPPYCSLKFHGHLPGGIANGITGLRSDGRGITFDGPTEPEKCWQQWRWREQWLPHASWYWVALTALTLGEERP